MALANKALGATFTKYLNVANPLALTELAGYWRADDMTAGATASWTDLSGNARHLLQATGGNQPVNTVNQINSTHSAMVFDGATQYFDTGASAVVIPQPWELWLLFKRISFVGGDFIFEAGNATLATYAQDQAATNVRSLSGSTTFNIAVGAVGSWLLMRWSSVAGASASSITLNNGTPATGTMTNGLQRLVLGAKVGGTLTPNIAVAEAFVTSNTLSAAKLSMIYTYYRTKYGLSV